MMVLITAQVAVGNKYLRTTTIRLKSTPVGDLILLILKLITPFYALFVFVVNMECM